jgi:hypothetical protein
MRKLNSKSRVFLAGMLLVALSMTVFSCLRIFRVDAPEEVETNSVFEVRLVLDDLLTDGHNHSKDIWGYLGVQLPVGWTINPEDVEYEYYPKQDRTENDGHTVTEYHTGTMEYDAGYVDNCFGNEYLEDDYYFTGFSTLQTEDECIDSIVVKIKIHTDGQLGYKVLGFYVQENGNEDAPYGDEITKKPIYPINVFRDEMTKEVTGTLPKPAAREETVNDVNDNGENNRRFVELTVQGSGTGIQTVTKDASYNVVALGNGQLQVNLPDSKKIDATALVYNMRGQIVNTRTLNQTSNVISGLTPGIYAVGVEKDGVRSVKKAIVK